MIHELSFLNLPQGPHEGQGGELFYPEGPCSTFMLFPIHFLLPWTEVRDLPAYEIR